MKSYSDLSLLSDSLDSLGLTDNDISSECYRKSAIINSIADKTSIENASIENDKLTDDDFINNVDDVLTSNTIDTFEDESTRLFSIKNKPTRNGHLIQFQRILFQNLIAMSQKNTAPKIATYSYMHTKNFRDDS